MTQGWDEVLHDFQLRAFGEELTRVNELPVGQRRAYVRSLWESRVRRGLSAEESGEAGERVSRNQFFQGAARE